MKKIGIITLWGELNYGAFLQSYALSAVLKDFGCESYFIEETNEKLNWRSIISLKPSNFIKNVYSCKLVREYWKDRKLLLKIGNRAQEYDICIIGSDEVWNVSNNHFKHHAFYIGEGVKYKKLVAYAPSSNGATGEDFLRVYGEHSLDRFSEIAVRDYVTQKMIFDILHCNFPIVLDPTFLVDSYENIEVDVSYKNYIFVYGYSFSDEEIKKIKEFANKNEKLIITAGSYHSWADKKIPASPRMFLGLIKRADFVITSTFHGTVFSIIYGRQFASIARNNLKIHELLNMFHLEQRIVKEDLSDLDTILKTDILTLELNKRISDLKKKSKTFLKKCIEDESNNF